MSIRYLAWMINNRIVCQIFCHFFSLFIHKYIINNCSVSVIRSTFHFFFYLQIELTTTFLFDSCLCMANNGTFGFVVKTIFGTLYLYSIFSSQFRKKNGLRLYYQFIFFPFIIVISFSFSFLRPSRFTL